MATKYLSLSMEDLHFYTISDICEMFEIYERTMSKKSNPTGKKYIGAEGLLDFVGGN